MRTTPNFKFRVSAPSAEEQINRMAPSSSASGISTSITHTLNVVETTTRNSFWSSSVERCITKYVVHVQLADGTEWQVARRYSHFRSNHMALSSMFSQLKLPKLPPKVLSIASASASSPPDPETVASRMVLLDSYLKQLLAMPAIATSTQMRTFLGAYQGMRPTWFSDMQRGSTGASGDYDDESAESRRSSSALTADEFAALTFSPLAPAAPSPAPIAPSSTSIGAAPSSDPPPLEYNVPYARGDVRAARALIAHLGLPMNVDAFVTQFDKKGYRKDADAAAGMAHRFLNGMEAAIAVSSTERLNLNTGQADPKAPPISPATASNWVLQGGEIGCATEGVLWCARDQLEDRLLHGLHDAVFGVLDEEIERDDTLHRRLSSLEGILTQPEQQLDVAPQFCDNRFNRWDAAAAELRQLIRVRTARAKMDCVLKCVLQLKQGLHECLAAKGGKGSLGADELFPVFVYVVMRANPPRLYSTLMYVQRFRSPMALKSEAGCYFTHLQAAVTFLESLAIEHEEKAAAAAEGDGRNSSSRRSSKDADAATAEPLDTASAAAATEEPIPPSADSARSDDGAAAASSDQPPTFSREALAQRRAQQVESAASTWERQIEQRLIGRTDSEQPSEGGGLSRQASAAGSASALRDPEAEEEEVGID